MINLRNVYEIRNVLDDKVIEKIEDEFGNIIYEAWRILTLSGAPPITLSNVYHSNIDEKYNNLVDYKVYGNSVQDGTPTPDTPIEIESVGDLTTKNLFDKNNALVFNGYLTSKQIVSYNPKPSAMALLCINCKPNTTYTISRQIQSKRFRLASSDMPPGTDTVINQIIISDNEMSGTITTSENDVYLYVWFYNKTVDTAYTYQEIMGGIQIEEGSTATSYEPYHKYKIPVMIRGKNLFNYSSTEPDGSYLNGNGTISRGGSSNLRTTDYMPIPDNTTYLTFSFSNGSMQSPGICLYDKDKNYITGSSFANKYITTIAVPSNAKYVRLSYRTINTNIQLECGSIATEYEPYQEPITTNIYLDKPLRKVGEYADYIDFENQKVVREIKYIEIPSNLDFKTYTYNNTVGVYAKNLLDDNYTRIQGLSNRNKIFNADMRYGTCMWVGVKNNFCYWVGILTYLGFGDDETSTAIDKLKEWLDNNPTYIYYPTATPTEETIELPTIPTHKGTTIVEIDTSISPSNMEVEYYAKGV